MKDIKGELGELNIELHLDANPFKQQPYCVNLGIKEEVNKEIQKMLATCLIFRVDKFKWIKPIVIQNKNDTKDIIVCVEF
jgi:hypothetical protein